MNVPKIIHQIWLGPNKRPDIWMDTWKNDYIKQNPDWTYKLWTETELENLSMTNKQIFNKEQFYNGKSDIARYEILYQQGGVFMDADSLWINKPNNSLNPILDMTKTSGMFCAEEPVNKWSIANGVIGFTKGHPILKQMIDFIGNNYYNMKKTHPKQRQIWIVTGTQPFTKFVKEYDEALILESYYFYPESFHKVNLHLNVKDFPKLYPNSIAFQYGYTTNNILTKNSMKNFIDSH